MTKSAKKLSCVSGVSARARTYKLSTEQNGREILTSYEVWCLSRNTDQR